MRAASWYTIGQKGIRIMKKDAENKKDRSIRPAVVVVIIFGLIVAILVAIPLVRHRQFVRYMTDLSSMTSRAGVKEMVV